MSCEEEELLRGASPAWCPRQIGTQGGDVPSRGTGKMMPARVGKAKVTPGLSQSHFPRTSLAAQKQHSHILGKEEAKLCCLNENGGLTPTSPAQEAPAGSHHSQMGSGRATAGGGQVVGGSVHPQLPVQHRASRCNGGSGQEWLRGKNKPGADYSGHVLAGGGEA